MSSKVDSKKFNPPPKPPGKERYLEKLKLGEEKDLELLRFDSLESEYEHFKNAYDKLKDTKDRPPIHDEDIIHTAISMLEDPKEIARELKKSPDKIFHEPVYQAVIWCLRNLCEREQNENHKWAKKLLRNMGLAIFIPDVPKRITDHAYLLHYQKNPEILKRDIKKYTIEIHKHINLEKSYEDNEKEILEFFEQTFNKKPPSGLLKRDRLYQISTIALAFLSYSIEAPYEALKKIYYIKK